MKDEISNLPQDVQDYLDFTRRERMGTLTTEEKAKLEASPNPESQKESLDIIKSIYKDQQESEVFKNNEGYQRMIRKQREKAARIKSERQGVEH